MSKNPIANFTVPATGGHQFSLLPLAKQYLVIFFYPKDNTPGCTTEVQQFRDLHEQFQQAACEVVGLSRDSIKSHEGFKEKFSLPYELLSDEDEKVCEQFGVMKLKNMYGKEVRGIERSTFIIDSNGMPLREWRGLKADGHAQEVLDFITTLA